MRIVPFHRRHRAHTERHEGLRHTARVQGGGALLPTPKYCMLPLYHMRIFVPNHVVSKSHFWYFVSQLKKMKKSSGKIVYCGRVLEKSPLQVKNCSIWLHYDSCSGTHNMYQEYQDLTAAGAITQCYRDMGAQPRT